MPKFKVTDRMPCWVTWTYEIEADDEDAAYAAYCDGDHDAPIGAPDIGDSIDYAGDNQIEVEAAAKLREHAEHAQALDPYAHPWPQQREPHDDHIVAWRMREDKP